MTRRAEPTPAAVPRAPQAGADQAGEGHPLWRWAKPCVWTVRMLTALLARAEGPTWFRLYDKVFSERNLLAAYQQVAAKDGAPGMDHVTTTEFGRQIPENLWQLSDALRDRTYRPQAIRRVHIPKPGTTETRPLGIPTVRDRIVQAAVVNVIEPIFERDFAEQSYGFRPGRSGQEALRRVDELLKAGFLHVVDADLKGDFDSIPHDRLMQRLRERIADGSLLSLIESFLTADILDGAAAWTPAAGAPQGAVLSPLLSNIYLDPLDHLMARRGFQMVRYADDFVILCRTADDAVRALDLVREWVGQHGLALHPEKTRLIDARTDRFEFLGYEFQGSGHWPRKKSLRKLKATLRQKTPRNSGRSLKCVVQEVNQTLRGWFACFQHSTRPSVYRDLDGWLRMRLRSLLRRRAGGRGVARDQTASFRWPNQFFAQHGLFSLTTAQAQARQSSRR